MPRILYIVSRERPDVYERLKRDIADEDVEIVLDRRQRERRREPRVVGGPGERRRGDRRVNSIATEIARVGWAMISTAPHPDQQRFAPGDRVVLRQYSPMMPRRLVGRTGRVIAIHRVRAEVHFEGETRSRRVSFTDLQRIVDRSA